MALRRAVLGEDYVDRATQDVDELSAPLQEIITEYCWGGVWARGLLSVQTRSLITVAMLTALNREEELRLHVRAAFTNGCTAEMLSEVILQSAVYCGVPASLEAMRALREVLEGLEGSGSSSAPD